MHSCMGQCWLCIPAPTKSYCRTTRRTSAGCWAPFCGNLPSTFLAPIMQGEFPDAVKELKDAIVMATLDVYRTCVASLLPRPTKSHYNVQPAGHQPRHGRPLAAEAQGAGRRRRRQGQVHAPVGASLLRPVRAHHPNLCIGALRSCLPQRYARAPACAQTPARFLWLVRSLRHVVRATVVAPLSTPLSTSICGVCAEISARDGDLCAQQ